MRIITSFIVGLVLTSVCHADPAPPYKTNLLSDIGNLDIRAGQWTLTKGVLSKNPPLYSDDMLLVVKEDVVKVPVWYFLGCELVNIRKKNGRLPEAGLLFGFIDEKNYWSLMIGQELTQPILKLVQVKDGKIVTETSAPLAMDSGQKKVLISAEIHHQIYVKVHANKSLALTHRVSSGIAQGKVGLTLQSGICGFSNCTISGIAKR